VAGHRAGATKLTGEDEDILVSRKRFREKEALLSLSLT